ncbi:hypothetical protein ACP4OV_008731 [Aristida adscensionis]
MGIAAVAPVAATFSSSSSCSVARPPAARAPSRAHVAAAGMSSRASAFVAGGGLAVAATRVAARPRRAGGGGALGCKCLFGLGVPELVVIAGVAALVFGPKQLPEIGRNIGKTVKSFQQRCKLPIHAGMPMYVWTSMGANVLEYKPQRVLKHAMFTSGTLFDNVEVDDAAKEFETELKKEPGEGGDQPPPATPTAVSGGDEQKELETSASKEST